MGTLITPTYTIDTNIDSVRFIGRPTRSHNLCNGDNEHGGRNKRPRERVIARTSRVGFVA